ncbi:MAG: hypothetical protein J1G04_06565 [Clostridiales bacterium]|nr:hypothetical protein [Clostridiales bacterium]
MSNNGKIKRRIMDALEETKVNEQADDVRSQSGESQDCDNIDDKQADDYGKFATAQELLNAYNALQSEFTKRCQLIKQLQVRLDECHAQAQSDVAADEACAKEQIQAQCAAPPDGKTTVAQSSVCDGEARLADAIAVIAQNIDDCADYLASLPQIADAVILTYKKKLLCPHSAPSPRGMAVVMPAHRPKTLAEAKRLADEMLKSGR